jgi:hypothetical protein
VSCCISVIVNHARLPFKRLDVLATRMSKVGFFGLELVVSEHIIVLVALVLHQIICIGLNHVSVL